MLSIPFRKNFESSKNLRIFFFFIGSYKYIFFVLLTSDKRHFYCFFSCFERLLFYMSQHNNHSILASVSSTLFCCIKNLFYRTVPDSRTRKRFFYWVPFFKTHFFYRMATILKQKNREYILFRDGEHYGTGSVPGMSSHQFPELVPLAGLTPQCSTSRKRMTA